MFPALVNWYYLCLTYWHSENRAMKVHKGGETFKCVQSSEIIWASWTEYLLKGFEFVTLKYIWSWTFPKEIMAKYHHNIMSFKLSEAF